MQSKKDPSILLKKRNWFLGYDAGITSSSAEHTPLRTMVPFHRREP
jgi:hypothetical protein